MTGRTLYDLLDEKPLLLIGGALCVIGLMFLCMHFVLRSGNKVSYNGIEVSPLKESTKSSIIDSTKKEETGKSVEKSAKSGDNINISSNSNARVIVGKSTGNITNDNSTHNIYDNSTIINDYSTHNTYNNNDYIQFDRSQQKLFMVELRKVMEGFSLSQDIPINLSYFSGGKSENLAHQIGSFLKSNGYNLGTESSVAAASGPQQPTPVLIQYLSQSKCIEIRVRFY